MKNDMGWGGAGVCCAPRPAENTTNTPTADIAADAAPITRKIFIKTSRREIVTES